MRVRVLDTVPIPGPCPNCGDSTAAIVDGDGQGRFWLLCLAVQRVDCIHTWPLPEGMTVEED